MNTAVKESGNAVAIFAHPNPVAILTDAGQFDKFYDGIRRECEAHVPDITSAKGRSEIAALAYKVARTKTFLDDAGKKLNEEARERINKVDAARREMRTRLDALKDEVRHPLTEWEEREEARQTQVAEAMTRFREASLVLADDTSETVAGRLAEIEACEIDPDLFQSQADAAVAAKDATVAALTAAIERLKKEEADRAELARLRAEAEERERQEAARAAKEAAEKAEAERKAREAEEEKRRVEAAAEAARREAERKAAAEKEAAERAHAEAMAKERAARERIEREAREAEERRLADERRAAEEQAKRDADKAHRAAVLKAAKEAIMSAGDIEEDPAKKIVLAIRAGEVPHVTLRF